MKSTLKCWIRSFSILSIATLALVGSTPLYGETTVVAPEVCQRVELSSLSSVYAPVWVESRSQVLLANRDPKSKAAAPIVGLLPSGGSAGPVYPKVPQLTAQKAGVPTLEQGPMLLGFSQVEDGFLQLSLARVQGPSEVDLRVTWFDPSFKPKGTVSLTNPPGASGIYALSALDWTVTTNDDGDEFLVFYGLYSDNLEASSYNMGIFSRRLHSPESGLRSSTQLLQPVLSSPSGYLGGGRYFASIGSVAYFLLLQDGGPAQLLRFEPGEDVTAKPLGGFPADEPQGLYSDGNLLYALFGSSEEWKLHQFDVSNDAVKPLRKMHVPSNAPSLTMLPADGRWFVFEHVSANDEGSRVPSMLVIPQEQIRDSYRSALYGAGAKSIQCAQR